MLALATSNVAAAGAPDQTRLDLRQASGSIDTGYRPAESDPTRTDVAVGRGKSVGSGVVVDSGGYIVTNAHVVAGAERIDIVVTGSSEGNPAAAGNRGTRILPARLA